MLGIFFFQCDLLELRNVQQAARALAGGGGGGGGGGGSASRPGTAHAHPEIQGPHALTHARLDIEGGDVTVGGVESGYWEVPLSDVVPTPHARFPPSVRGAPQVHPVYLLY
jgi:hypothetical protein